MQTKVSIVIAIYNSEQYLRRCLESVVGQTLADIEIICVDDGSTDDSITIMEEYVKKDLRIRTIIHNHNQGIAMTRKSGVMVAQGQYIMFLDGDDELLLNACEVAYETIEKEKTDAVGFGVKTIDNSGCNMQIDFSAAEYVNRWEDHNLLHLWLKGKLKNWEIWNKIYRADLCKAALFTRYLSLFTCFITQSLRSALLSMYACVS